MSAREQKAQADDKSKALLEQTQAFRENMVKVAWLLLLGFLVPKHSFLILSLRFNKNIMHYIIPYIIPYIVPYIIPYIIPYIVPYIIHCIIPYIVPY